MQVVPFQADHLEQLPLQDSQMHLSGWVSEEQGIVLEGSPSYTAIHDGEPIAVAGILPCWHGRAIAWAFLSDIGPRDFLMIHRAVERFLDNCGFNRVEISVDCDFPAAHRWARLLGFEMEANCMRGYGPDGRDCALYARLLS